MIEWIVTSCILIFVVLGIRLLLKNRISGRLRYGLWLLVLIRLLIPLSLPSGMSVMNLLPEESPEQLTVGYVDYELPDIAVQEPNPGLPQDLWQAKYEENVQEYQQQIQQAKIDTGTPVTLGQILLILWITGMAVTTCILVSANLHFALRLKRSRERLALSETPLPVYVSAYVQTPCLFGLITPGIYLTPELSDKKTLRHVLIHELTHWRHWDHIWSLLRCVCLVLHWYNPLVWVAASLSKQDAELACDESVIRALGESERSSYGQTLIDMTCVQRNRKAMLVAATTMVSGKKALKERVIRIAKHPKTAIYALICLILVAAVAVGCTFTGAQDSTEPPEDENIYVTEIYDNTLYVYQDISNTLFIRLRTDGTFKYYQNKYYQNDLNVHSYTGVWKIENEILTLAGAPNIGISYVNRFRVEKDSLVWLADGSDGFIKQQPHDGAIFHATQEETIMLFSAALEGFVTAESLKSGIPCQVELLRSAEVTYHDLELVITSSSSTIRQVVTAVERDEPCVDEKLYLADLDGDGVCEIILHEDCGGNGGYGSYRSRVFKVENNALTEIFEVAPYDDMDTGFYWEIAEPFAFLIRNRYTGLSLKLEADQYRKDYYFDDEGKLTVDLNAYPLNVDNFYEFYPKDVDGDGVYELCASQYAWDIAHIDGVGEAKCVIKYDSSAESFRVVQADFITIAE